MSIVPSSLRVVDLRKELSSRGLPTKGKKKDLVKRLEKALAQEPAAAPSTDNSNNEISLNSQSNASEEKVSEVTGSEQIVEPAQEKKISDKPAEETIQQNVEPSSITQNIAPNESIEISIEQQVNPVQDLTDNKLGDESSKNDQQVIEEPIIETPKPEEETEKPIDIILNPDMVQVDVIEKPAEESVHLQSSEELIVKPQEQLIEKSSEELIEKPQEQLIEKSSEELIEKPQEQLIEKSSEELIEKPQEQLIAKSSEELIEKPSEQLIENPLDQLIQNPINPFLESAHDEEDLLNHRDAVSMIAREQMVTPPRDDTEIKAGADMLSTNDVFKTQDSMLFDEDRGTKRKMDEELHGEMDKKQKTTLNDSVRLMF